MNNHFDKNGNPLFNSIFGQYAKENVSIKVDRSHKNGKKAKKEKDLGDGRASDWDPPDSD